MFRLPSLLPRLPSLFRSTLSPSCSSSKSASLLFSSPLRSFSSSPAPALQRKPTKLKLKTHKGAAKRWTKLAGGEFKRGKTGRVHLNSSGAMSPTRLNRLGETAYASGAEKRTLRRLMPYA
ncbi:hypothetical protein JCM11251_001961 [Rhodosporidiobolus azoricus]